MLVVDVTDSTAVTGLTLTAYRTRKNEIGPACNRWQNDHYPANNGEVYRGCEQKGKFFWGNLDSYIHYDCNPGCGNWCHKKDYHPVAPMFGARYGIHVFFVVQRCTPVVEEAYIVVDW